MTKVQLYCCVAASALLLTNTGCSDDKPSEGAMQTLRADIVSAAEPSVILGKATLAANADGGVKVNFDIAANDVITSGSHAIHIHENGSCDSLDTNNDGQAEAAGAAGGHFNPTGVGHGDDNGPHAGDSDNYNYMFGDDGSFTAEVVFSTVPAPIDQSLLSSGGTALVIHAGGDDKKSDPSGEAGPRVACAVIQAK